MLPTPISRETLPHWSDISGCWCSHDHSVYRYSYDTGTLRKVFSLPPKAGSAVERLKNRLARSWLRRRFWPSSGLHSVVALANGDVVVIYDRIYWYSSSRHGRYAEVLTTEGARATSPLRGGVAVHTQSQLIYYGEYLNGHDCEIRVCRINVAARKIEICWAFARSDIKHIHAIHYDRFRNRLWICTGDLDHESTFYYTDDEFQTVHRFAGGDQSWRAIALLFDETGMEWGMDAGKDAPADAINRIYRYEFASGSRTELAVIGNPAYSTCQFSDGTAMMATTFEPGRRQDTPEEAALWYRGQDRQWRKTLRLPYAPHPRAGVSRYGSILLPGGISPAGQLLLTPVNCSTGNHRLYSLWIGTAHEQLK